MINSPESLAQSSFWANQKQISWQSRLGKTLMYFKFALDIRGAVEPEFKQDAEDGFLFCSYEN